MRLKGCPRPVSGRRESPDPVPRRRAPGRTAGLPARWPTDSGTRVSPGVDASDIGVSTRSTSPGARCILGTIEDLAMANTDRDETIAFPHSDRERGSGWSLKTEGNTGGHADQT